MVAQDPGGSPLDEELPPNPQPEPAQSADQQAQQDSSAQQTQQSQQVAEPTPAHPDPALIEAGKASQKPLLPNRE